MALNRNAQNCTPPVPPQGLTLLHDQGRLRTLQRRSTHKRCIPLWMIPLAWRYSLQRVSWTSNIIHIQQRWICTVPLTTTRIVRGEARCSKAEAFTVINDVQAAWGQVQMQVWSRTCRELSPAQFRVWLLKEACPSPGYKELAVNFPFYNIP